MKIILIPHNRFNSSLVCIQDPINKYRSGCVCYRLKIKGKDITLIYQKDADYYELVLLYFVNLAKQ